MDMSMVSSTLLLNSWCSYMLMKTCECDCWLQVLLDLFDDIGGPDT